MATFIDIPDIAAACPNGLDPLDRAGQIKLSLNLWVRIEASGTPTDIGYGIVAGVGRVESLDGTDLDAFSTGILTLLNSGVAPITNPFTDGFTELQLTGYQNVQPGTMAFDLERSNGRWCFYNINKVWEDMRSGTLITPAWP